MSLIEALIWFVGTGESTESLLAWHRHAFGCVVIWFVFGPAWSMATATAWRRAEDG